MDNQWLESLRTMYLYLLWTDFILQIFLYSPNFYIVQFVHKYWYLIFSCLLDERKKQFILQAFHCIEIPVFISIISMNFYQNRHACLKLSLNFGKKIDEFIFSILITSNACNIKVIFLCWDETVKLVIGVMYVLKLSQSLSFLGVWWFFIITI